MNTSTLRIGAGKGDELMWIRDFREKMGLELDDFARVVNAYRVLAGKPINGIVSNTLIHILEVSRHGVTHPVLADAIATVCGATQKQRDGIVARQHRGGWKPDEDSARLVKLAIYRVTGKLPGDELPGDDDEAPRKSRDDYKFCGAVKVDFDGHVLATYATLTEAARDNDLSHKYVWNRCQRKRRDGSARGKNPGFTFRYMDEWEAMSPEERIEDLK
jgi:hypothetical protein